jgi:hypothetical protein
MATALTYAQRNALAEKPALTPLGKTDFLYTPGKPEFEGIVAGILGNVGTAGDGFDALFHSVASIVDGDIAAIGALDSILTGVGFVAGAFDAAVLAPIVKEHASFLQGGTSALAAVDAGFGGSPPPPPAPPAPKPKPKPQPPTSNPKQPPGGTPFGGEIPPGEGGVGPRPPGLGRNQNT